jgi:hypothetical protein
MGESQKLVAILVADIVGYGRLASADEDRTLARLRGLRSDLVDPAIAAHHDRIVKRTGDGSIIEFRSVVDAVRCAIEVQTGMVERNAGLPPERLGDVLELCRATALSHSDCQAKTAVDVVRGPKVDSAIMCAMNAQSMLARTDLVQGDGTQYMKVVCRPSKSADEWMAEVEARKAALQ